MKIQFYYFITAIALIFSNTSAIAQQAIVASGGTVSGVDATLNFTVGQTVYLTHLADECKLSEGVQQPFVIRSTYKEEGVSDIKIFPVPANDFIRIKADYFVNMNYLLFDAKGVIIKSAPLSSTLTKVDLKGLPEAAYVLNIQKNKKEVKSFKFLIKH